MKEQHFFIKKYKILGAIWLFLALWSLLLEGTIQFIASLGLVTTSLVIVLLLVVNIMQNKAKK